METRQQAMLRNQVEIKIESARNRGERPVFKGVDWSGADLSGLDVSGAIFDDATLVGVNFKAARLDDVSAINANFRDADMTWASALNADFSSADFSGAVMVGANLADAVMSSAMARNANMGFASFEGADMAGVYARGANLESTAMGGTYLKGAVLIDALIGAGIRRSAMTGAVVDALVIPNLGIGALAFLPTHEGWRIHVQRWKGSVEEFRAILSGDASWPYYFGNNQEPEVLEAVANLCEVYATAHLDAVERARAAAEKWGQI